MADYWKSQARKYCNFCKCWIADNKPSIQYHENGKRHKENVAKKISTLAKQSAKQYKENAQLDQEMKKMEQDALKAYKKDIESKADITSQEINDRLAEAAAEKSEGKEQEQNKGHKETTTAKKSDKKEQQLVWHEEKTEQGHVYYWNTSTLESIWEPPPEPYLSLKDKKRLEEEKKKRSQSEEERKAKEKIQEVKAFEAREKMKQKYNKTEKNKKKNKAELVEAKKMDKAKPSSANNKPTQPYGKWTTVVKVEQKPIDLQLPQKVVSEHKVAALAAAANLLAANDEDELPPYRIRIEEKTLASSFTEDSSSSPQSFSFKKRKLNNKSNMRQRLDDDDN